MKPALVVDIGNSFIKWGRCANGAVVDKAYLPPNDPDAWQRQRENWRLNDAEAWAVAGVQPERSDVLVKWLRQRGDNVLLLERSHQLPLQVRVEKPDHVGMDRLLDAVAANGLRRSSSGAVIIDAGSAVTVDWVDASGAFCGGSIFPGPRLMAEALHDYTALLPLIQVQEPAPLPGRSTPAAMEAGIFWAVVGGIRAIIDEMPRQAGAADFDIFLTGGDAGKLESALRESLPPEKARRLHLVPLLTLEGIRQAAEARP